MNTSTLPTIIAASQSDLDLSRTASLLDENSHSSETASFKSNLAPSSLHGDLLSIKSISGSVRASVRPNTPRGFLRKMRNRRSDAQSEIDSTPSPKQLSPSSQYSNKTSPASTCDKSQNSNPEEYVKISPVKKPRRSLKENEKRIAAVTRVQIRRAEAADADAISNIMNHYIHTTVKSLAFGEENVMYTKQRLIDLPRIGLPVIVAVGLGGVVGVIRAFPTCPWGRYEAGYNHSAEIKVFVDHHYFRRGIGQALMRKMIEVMTTPTAYPTFTAGWFPQYKYRNLIVEIVVEAKPTDEEEHEVDQVECFFEKFGFVKAGTLKNLAWKQQQWLDVSLMQLELEGEWSEVRKQVQSKDQGQDEDPNQDPVEVEQ